MDVSKKTEKNDSGVKTVTSDVDMEGKGTTLEEAIILTGKTQLNGTRPKEEEIIQVLKGHGKFHYLLLLASTLCLTSFSFENQSISYLLPATQCDFPMTSNEKGLLASVQNIGIMVGSHFWGYMADTRGRKKILMFATLMDSLCCVASSFSPNFWTFFAFRFFNGFFMCALSTVIFAYQGEFHSAQTRSTSILVACGVSSIEALFIPVLAWLIIPQDWAINLPLLSYKSWRIFLLVCALPSFLAFICLKYFFPESPKFLMAVGKETDAIDVLRKVYTINHKSSTVTYKVDHLTAEKEMKPDHDLTENIFKTILKSIAEQTVPLFKFPHVKYSLLVCSLQFGFFFCCNSVYIWTAEIFSRLATYSKMTVDQNVTFCDAMVYGSHVSGYINDTNPVISLHDNITGLNDVISGINTIDVSNNACSVNMDISIFTNTFILSSVFAAQYFAVGFIVKYVGIKIIIVTCMVISTGSILTVQFVSTTILISVFCDIYVSFVGLGVNILTSKVVDIFPTHLRAMIISLSLMIGRLGAITGNTLVGSTIDGNCSLLLYILAAGPAVCGFLALFLPSSQKKVSDT